MKSAAVVVVVTLAFAGFGCGPPTVTFDVLEPAKRPVSAVADYTEVRDVASVTVTEDGTHTLTLLFDPEHNLEERILKEQFLP